MPRATTANIRVSNGSPASANSATVCPRSHARGPRIGFLGYCESAVRTVIYCTSITAVELRGICEGTPGNLRRVLNVVVVLTCTKSWGSAHWGGLQATCTPLHMQR